METASAVCHADPSSSRLRLPSTGRRRSGAWCAAALTSSPETGDAENFEEFEAGESSASNGILRPSEFSPNHFRAESSNGSAPLAQDDEGSSPSTPLDDARAVFWKRHLYVLQQTAPEPKCVECMEGSSSTAEGPTFYGLEYHGPVARQTADLLVEQAGEGGYLVRQSQRAPNAFTLCMRFDGCTKNYKLFYDGNLHYVGEKRFETVRQLVADGLISMYVEKHAADYIKQMAEQAVYDETPYSQYKKTLEYKTRGQVGSLGRNRGEPRVGPPVCDSPLARRGTRPLPLVRDDPLPYPATITCKSHSFRAHTFKGPHWCDFCGNFMWGLVQQGVKCEHCGFGAHRKCEEKVPQDCRPDMKYVRRIFGVDLTTLCMAHNSRMPDVVAACLSEIESRGLEQEGLYRVPGSHDEIARLRAQFDADGRADLSREAVEDVNSVCGLLKLFLRSLPQPLLTDSVRLQLLEALRRRYDCDRSQGARRALRQLPPAHRTTLGALLRHLARVARRSARNKMDADNLSRVFAPTLMGRPTLVSLDFPVGSGAGVPTPIDKAALLAPQHDQSALQFLIVNCSTLFFD